MPTPTRHATPWIDVMIPISLPVEERRAALRSFWFLVSVGVGAAVWLAGLPLERALLPMIALAAAVACWLLVLAAPDFVRRCYRAWDRILVRPFTRLACGVTLRICFFVICAAG